MTKPPIRPVLEHYGWDGRTTGYGAWNKTRCPFHADRNPSASINEEEGLFQCHAGCLEGEVQDAYGVLMKHEGIDFLRAKERVKELTGDAGEDRGGALGRGPAHPGRLAASKLPLWAQKKHGRKLT